MAITQVNLEDQRHAVRSVLEHHGKHIPLPTKLALESALSTLDRLIAMRNNLELNRTNAERLSNEWIELLGITS